MKDLLNIDILEFLIQVDETKMYLERFLLNISWTLNLKCAWYYINVLKTGVFRLSVKKQRRGWIISMVEKVTERNACKSFPTLIRFSALK